MRTIAPVFFLLAQLIAIAGLAADNPSHHDAPSGLTVKGEVLDLACYLAHGGKGPDHRKCAARCAEQGQPIGFLTTTGEVYLLMADHVDMTAFEQAKKLAGQEVEITGKPAERDGMSGLTVLAVKKL